MYTCLDLAPWLSLPLVLGTGVRVLRETSLSIYTIDGSLYVYIYIREYIARNTRRLTVSTKRQVTQLRYFSAARRAPCTRVAASLRLFRGRTMADAGLTTN